MEDFNALAAALGAGIRDVRGCLILSSDGLVLGAHPENAELDARPARIKIAALGEPQRGFLQFGTEIWCYVRRGPYAALAVTGTAARPGLVIDQMEQVLLQAEESRSRRDRLEAATPPAPAQVATTKPRTQLHPDPRPVEEPVIIRAERAAVSAAPSAVQPSEGRSDEPDSGSDDRRDEPESGSGGGEEDPTATPAAEPTDPAERQGEPADEVDRFSLAREFSRLLQDDRDGADG
jgi:hypothetical protein